MENQGRERESNIEKSFAWSVEKRSDFSSQALRNQIGTPPGDSTKTQGAGANAMGDLEEEGHLTKK